MQHHHAHALCLQHYLGTQLLCHHFRVLCGTAKLHCTCPVALVYKPPPGGGYFAAGGSCLQHSWVCHLVLERNKQDAMLEMSSEEEVV